MSLVEYVLLGSFLALSVASMLPMIGANLGHVVERVRGELTVNE